jgi:hypothetical protein
VKRTVVVSITVATLFMTVTASYARAQGRDPRWQQVHVAAQRDGNGDGFIDTTTIKRRGDTVTVWTRREYSTPQRDSLAKVEYSIEVTQAVVVCQSRVFDILASAEYGRDGSVVDSWTVPEGR